MRRFSDAMRTFIKKILYKERYDSKSYVNYLKKRGARIGEGTTIFSPRTTIIDEQQLWMLDIGKYVQITAGCVLLTHDFSWSVLKGRYGEIVGAAGKITIGNNVFIGMNSVVLKGAKIGNNVIIGAGSIVSGEIPDDCVAVGNPCRPIMSLEDYYHKRKNAYREEGKELVREFRTIYGNDPGEKELREFFFLFCDNPKDLKPLWKRMMSICGNEEDSYKKLCGHEKYYSNIQEYLNSIS
ncbi:acyltransferase [Butyrivibrio sp. AE2015]|uniref:acyltransferase n=1 Tax=Butyrivibrio sp. AE2015 TaxID=1280663 RepID=UPI0003B31F37|nr:acyltransferase [Butyrivibrio sp. AE2015]